MTPPTYRPVDPVTHARLRLLTKARDMWIAGNPDLSARWQTAQAQLESPDDAAIDAGLREVSGVLHEAVQAIGGVRR